MNVKNILLVGGACLGPCLGLFFRRKISDLFYECIVDNVTGMFCYEITVPNTKNPRSAYAVKNELTTKLGPIRCTVVNDGIIEPEYTIPYGRYFLSEEFGYVYVIYTEDTTTMRLIPRTGMMWTIDSKQRSELFHAYMTRIYRDYCSSCKIVVFYVSSGDRWAVPIIRQPRDFDVMKKTPEMERFLVDLKRFKEDEKNFVINGIPFRKGYMLVGPPGTGKSTCVELASKMYNMGIYMLNLNAKEMSDPVLINLIGKVPPNSIINIEEVDKQMDNLKKINNVYVSLGGILTALDGPQRLSHGTIVVLTANRAEFLAPDDSSALLRVGRIDTVYNFQTKLTIM